MTTPQVRLTEADREAASELAGAAWLVRGRARILGKTAVGCAVLASDDSVHIGCNVEHRFRSHDIHAEVNAIGSMIASGARELRMVVIAAERERFTPCGACLDWIFEFGGGDCLVAWQRLPGDPLTVLRARELMPYYPT
ncbi:cytidine deaminase [Acidothermaceae bacterium B102]|nr:cytidine deaminase [Acidothermaceae bacterium B102]